MLWIQGLAGEPSLNGDLASCSTLQRKQVDCRETLTGCDVCVTFFTCLPVSQYLAKVVRPVPHRLEILPYSQVSFASTSERVKVCSKGSCTLSLPCPCRLPDSVLHRQSFITLRLQSTFGELVYGSIPFSPDCMACVCVCVVVERAS